MRLAVASQFAVSVLWEGGEAMRRIQASCVWGIAFGFNKKKDAALARGGTEVVFDAAKSESRVSLCGCG
jgi:hypothetical protein